MNHVQRQSCQAELMIMADVERFAERINGNNVQTDQDEIKRRIKIGCVCQ